MRILLTGGAGFIGSHLCRKLLAGGHNVICVDNLITGAEANIRELFGHKEFTFINHDISNPLRISEPLDWVMHFASPASPKDYLQSPIETIKAGTLGTHVCLGIAKAHQAKFFLASTSEVYGDPAVSPQPEEYWGNVNPTGPRSCYDEAKRAGEAFAFAYYRKHSIRIHVSRIFNTYGPNMRVDDGRVISNFIVQALKGEDITIFGSGHQTRSFCFIDDLVEGIIRYMEIEYPGPLNLGSTFEYTIAKLADCIIKLTGTRSSITYEPLPRDDPKQRRPDNSNAERLLGWVPKTDLDTGLKKTIRYFSDVLGRPQE